MKVRSLAISWTASTARAHSMLCLSVSHILQDYQLWRRHTSGYPLWHRGSQVLITATAVVTILPSALFEISDWSKMQPVLLWILYHKLTIVLLHNFTVTQTTLQFNSCLISFFYTRVQERMSDVAYIWVQAATDDSKTHNTHFTARSYPFWISYCIRHLCGIGWNWGWLETQGLMLWDHLHLAYWWPWKGLITNHLLVLHLLCCW